MTLHLNGMRHEVHNDSSNGLYAYVFSLTRDASAFTGGETCVARANVFDAYEPRQNNAWHGYFEVFPPLFNQLVLFDDRLAHMVPVVQGSMDPERGRVCLTGHLR
jgi:Rps23 Pro-64 3,4-dihydroxylase Tpa1-like proline 4-hydroxylase